MSNNNSAKRKSYRFALRSSMYIALMALSLLIVIWWLFHPLALWLVVVFPLLLFALSFFVIQIRAQKFIYRRINKIYDELSSLETSSLLDKSVTTDMRTLTEQVERFAQRKKIEIETLKVRENYRKEFLGNISHELKTPLFTIQGYIDTLIDGAHKDKVIRKKYLNRAQKGVERLAYIVKDMDMITRLEAGEMSLYKTDFDLIRLIHQVFDQFEMKAQKKNISLVMERLDEEPVIVNADAERVQQVLSNLVVNSLKYGKDNGTTEIAVEDFVNNKVIVRVTDNGEGIDPEYLPRLFERFFRVDRTGSRTEGGSGLGLSIVKHIMDAHHESIYVDSEVGIGSEFSFTLEKTSVDVADIEVFVDEDGI